MNEIKAA